MMGCAAEQEWLPSSDFVEEANRPPCLYFETDERCYQGVCCVCYKKGGLGRCPNPSCGLFMHHACVMSSESGGDQHCPVCRTQMKLNQTTSELEQQTELPYWHEAEIGAAVRRKNWSCAKRTPEVGKPPFPGNRWPTVNEAKLHG